MPSGESEEEQREDLASLMVRYQNGELAAFRSLYHHLAPRLRGYLIALTWNRELAEDLLQETFLQMHRSRRTYSAPRPVAPWAFAIAKHCFLMERRSFARKRRLEVSTSASEEAPEIPVPAEVESLADRALLQSELVKLPEEQREALLLHHVWGFSFKEIGSMLGIGAGASKLRSHRGMQELRRRLTKRAGERDV